MAMIEVIMSCISCGHFRLLWNGVSKDVVKASRGLWEGDPISPYLLILCMEWLSHLVQKEV